MSEVMTTHGFSEAFEEDEEEDDDDNDDEEKEGRETLVSAGS